MAGNSINQDMINFICGYVYGTRSFNQNSLHIAIMSYIPELTMENSYLNACKGIYQVIPMADFSMTSYNTCFMFQQDKTVNLMKETLEQFDLIPNLDNLSILGTLRK
jgi:hypothetical protein